MTYTPLKLAPNQNALVHVSIAGKIINLRGNGLHTDLNSLLVKVYVVCGGVATRIDRVLALGNITQVVLNANAPQICVLNYTWGQSAFKFYNFRYRL